MTKSLGLLILMTKPRLNASGISSGFRPMPCATSAEGALAQSKCGRVVLRNRFGVVWEE